VRRRDRQTSEDEAIDLLTNGEFGVLSMCSTDSKGYGVPLNFVVDRDKIYFHCATEGTKLNNIRENNKVSFCVVGKTTVLPSKFGTLYSSVIVNGTIFEIEGDEKLQALILFLKKYSPDFIEEGKAYIEKQMDKVKILRLSIETISGKARKY
jgi:nitroimidazol reductase NimA-like FMN-containing flavoprotein (pyridoxamine 5'-phosphate oxidase superfamily)